MTQATTSYSGATAKEQRLYTPEEYLDLETNAEFRSEYDNGVITPTTGGTANHNRICRNLCTALTIGLRGQRFEVFISDLKVWVPTSQKFRYPDIMVTAGEPEYYQNRKTTVTNPQIIIEVLSESTEEFDREDKFRLYQSIPSFQEYLLIDQSQIAIDHFYKTQPKHWQIDQFDDQDTEIKLKSIDVTLSIAEIYDKVTL
ncbi:Uma2 family endonuclease [Leptolyngbya sp. GGD]|uniref:Uma2 family endonuclease n=1 Tax=Leptolyngbya sp. GGD TaxID=2997907 RepID=UPI00227AAE4F|nr:Uma2 family endonuclease [Leptolyngbya sp. GGD]MCY6491673.1 Uma2 family endonuclease [Leptolyngbya sp. GGD]